MGFALCTLFLPVCAIPSESPNPAPRAFSAYPLEQQQIYDALFAHMFAQCRKSFDAPERFFLKLDGFDAPDDLLARFTAQGYTVVPGYRYKHDRGVRCSADAIRLDSPIRATVYRGYLFGPLGGEWGQFVLVEREGKWTIVSWKPDLFA
jgi:hypothetical protein